MRYLHSLFLLLALTSCHQKPESIEALPSQYVTIDDSIKVHYKQWGEGSRSEDMRLLFIDLPGYGQSSKPHVEYTLSFFSQAVTKVLDEVKCD